MAGKHILTTLSQPYVFLIIVSVISINWNVDFIFLDGTVFVLHETNNVFKLR